MKKYFLFLFIIISSLGKINSQIITPIENKNDKISPHYYLGINSKNQHVFYAPFYPKYNSNNEKNTKYSDYLKIYDNEFNHIEDKLISEDNITNFYGNTLTSKLPIKIKDKVYMISYKSNETSIDYLISYFNSDEMTETSSRTLFSTKKNMESDNLFDYSESEFIAKIVNGFEIRFNNDSSLILITSYKSTNEFYSSSRSYHLYNSNFELIREGKCNVSNFNLFIPDLTQTSTIYLYKKSESDNWLSDCAYSDAHLTKEGNIKTINLFRKIPILTHNTSTPVIIESNIEITTINHQNETDTFKLNENGKIFITTCSEMDENNFLSFYGEYYDTLQKKRGAYFIKLNEQNKTLKKMFIPYQKNNYFYDSRGINSGSYTIYKKMLIKNDMIYLIGEVLELASHNSSYSTSSSGISSYTPAYNTYGRRHLIIVGFNENEELKTEEGIYKLPLIYPITKNDIYDNYKPSLMFRGYVLAPSFFAYSSADTIHILINDCKSCDDLHPKKEKQGDIYYIPRNIYDIKISENGIKKVKISPKEKDFHYFTDNLPIQINPNEYILFTKKTNTIIRKGSILKLSIN